ncbi:MAG: MSHA biogenesis protein MshJ [Pseudomonadota bacterium]
MKPQWEQQWEQLTNKIDALTLRERGILLVVIAFVIIFLFNSLLIEPQYLKQKILSDKIKQEQAQIAATRMEIAQRVANISVDPDAELKKRIAGAEQQLLQIDNSLQDLQKNLVRPEKMTGLLESMLKRNHKLQLLSLKNLPVVNVIDEMEDTLGLGSKIIAVAKGVTGTSPNVAEQNMHGAIYKHEVEIVLQGSYLDMLNYMRELESLPEQVYWNKGKLTVIEYPKASLSLSVFTLSLEKKWLNL